MHFFPLISTEIPFLCHRSANLELYWYKGGLTWGDGHNVMPDCLYALTLLGTTIKHGIKKSHRPHVPNLRRMTSEFSHCTHTHTQKNDHRLSKTITKAHCQLYCVIIIIRNVIVALILLRLYCVYGEISLIDGQKYLDHHCRVMTLYSNTIVAFRMLPFFP